MSAKSASPMGKLGKEKTKESSRQEALIAMQEAAMGMSQADGFQPGPMGVEGIVLLSQEDEESEKSESGKGKGGDDDKSSVHSYVQHRLRVQKLPQRHRHVRHRHLGKLTNRHLRTRLLHQVMGRKRKQAAAHVLRNQQLRTVRCSQRRLFRQCRNSSRWTSRL